MTSDLETIQVLLVDDHPVVRDGYRRLLENTPEISVVGEADSGEEACHLYEQCHPNVVVMDLNMPGIGGLEAISRIRAKDPKAIILVFSMHDSYTMVRRVLEAGAAGYISKSSAASQMIEAVTQVANGKSFVDPAMVMDGVVQTQVDGLDPLKKLTQREYQIFINLAEGKSVVGIAEEFSISPKTAGVHQTNIMKKLELRNAAELTRLAIRCSVIEA